MVSVKVSHWAENEEELLLGTSCQRTLLGCPLGGHSIYVKGHLGSAYYKSSHGTNLLRTNPYGMTSCRKTSRGTTS
jgi:hypothetical protein